MKRITAVFSVLALIISVSAVNSFASSPVISIDSKEVYAGETAELDVHIQGNPGIVAMYLDIRYDSRLTLTDVKDKGLFKDSLFSDDISAVPMVLSWDDSLSQADSTANGTVAQLVFSVPKGTPAGAYTVSVSYDKNEIYNSKLENVDFSVVNGTITVKQNIAFEDSYEAYRSGDYFYFIRGTTVLDIKNKSQTGTYITDQEGIMSDDKFLCSGNTVCFPDNSTYTCVLSGDVNGDGNITAADARLTLRNSVGLEIFNIWQTEASDVDFSKKTTSSDARLILRASVGLEDPDVWIMGFSTEFIDVSKELALTDKSIVTTETNYYAAGSFITSQLKAFNTKIDLKEYSVNLNDAKLLIKEFVNVVPELFYVVNSVKVISRDNIIESFEFTFIDNAEEKSEDYKNLIASIASRADKNWSTVQKVLFFHDYLCSNYSYDDSLSVYDAYSMITLGKGVCQAYALLFKALLAYHGIDSKYVTSEKMNHGWNIVKIASRWYHVDVTWDDPQNDRYGLAYHKNMLLSDSAIEKTGHKEWYSFGGNETCDSTYYDDYFWIDITSPFVNLNNKWYYIDNYSSMYAIFEWNENGGNNIVRSFSSKWTSVPDGAWAGCYSGFGVYDNKLVYNTSDAVISYDPQTDVHELLYKENLSRQIFGMTVKDKIYINLDTSPDSANPDIRAIDIMYTGDCDGNGSFNAKDYTVLLRYCAGYSSDCMIINSDFDLNGKVNIKDADALRRFIVNG